MTTRFPFVALINGSPMVVESTRAVRPLTVAESDVLAESGVAEDAYALAHFASWKLVVRPLGGDA